MRRGFLLGNKSKGAKPSNKTAPDTEKNAVGPSKVPETKARSEGGPSTNFGASSTEQPNVHLSFAGCPICRDLNPMKATRDNDGSSWAQKEFNIASSIPAGSFQVETASSILKTAQNGCMYCKTIAVTLNTMSPGWENRDAYLEIFLAKDLPMTVRLKFGSLKTIRADDNFLKDLGIVLQGGRTLDFNISVSVDQKPDVEFEIYRHRRSGEKVIMEGHDITPFMDRFGFATPRQDHPFSEICCKFIEDRMHECRSKHLCGSQSLKPLLPDRVIWTRAPNASRIRLLEPKGIRADYIALSYCWGAVSRDTYLTRPSTVESRRSGIYYNDLPLLFRDVVNIAHTLNIEIDRLCIIQGNERDFSTQAPKMGDIYGNASLTIAAAVESENEPILVPRDIQRWGQYKFTVRSEGEQPIDIHFRRRHVPIHTEESGGDYGRISSRAWIWQERLLSARTVFFTAAAVKFECRCSASWEGYCDDNRGHSWSSQLDEDPHLSWTHLIQEYTKRKITRPSDRLPALEGVMRRIAQRTNWTPIYGLWKESLLQTLGWQIQDSGRMEPGKMHEVWYAPTWSWASVDGTVSYVNAAHGIQLNADDPFEYCLESLNLGQDGKSLHVSGEMIWTRCRLENIGTMRSYALKWDFLPLAAPEAEDWHPINADADLLPSAGIHPADHKTSTIRVPYGQARPLQDWESGCYVLLLGRSKLRCLALVLGRSPTRDDAWARIGIIDGVRPEVFERSMKQSVIIV